MIVFHGSNQIVKEPNISYSKNYLDFGKGFYITTFQNQAEKWAKRKASRYDGNAILICIVNQNVLDTLLKFSKYHTVN